MHACVELVFSINLDIQRHGIVKHTEGGNRYKGCLHITMDQHFLTRRHRKFIKSVVEEFRASVECKQTLKDKYINYNIMFILHQLLGSSRLCYMNHPSQDL